jgi:hypothetical protein
VIQFMLKHFFPENVLMCKLKVQYIRNVINSFRFRPPLSVFTAMVGGREREGG